MPNKLDSKGRITVPRQVRDCLSLIPGDLVEFERDGDGTVLMRRARHDIRSLKGIVRPPARSVTPESMGVAIKRRATRQR